MPELPEVETVCRGLAKTIQGHTITRVHVARTDLRKPLPPHFADQLQGRTISGISRRAKYALVHLEKAGHEPLIWLFHLGMSGRIVFAPAETPPALHDHVRLGFENGQELRYNDPRRFGLMDILTPQEVPNSAYFTHLGPEPLGPNFTGTYLYNALQKRKTAIKPTLMDSKLVVGVGNIYASEALFRARIHPQKVANTLSKPQAVRLCDHIKATLEEAIAAGGTSLRDYVQTDGNLGYFQHSFAVYGRDGKPCTICKTPIEKTQQAQRSTYFCPKCQKK